MKHILVIALLLISIIPSIKADELEDSLEYYDQRIIAGQNINNLEVECDGLKHYLQIYKEVFIDVSQDTTFAKNEAYYGYLCSQLGDYESAIEATKVAMEINKYTLGEYHPDYALSLSNLANYYSKLGIYSEAVRLETEALEIYKKVLGEEHPYYARSFYNLAGYYSGSGVIQLEVIQLIVKRLSSDRKHILRAFSYLTAIERQIYWQNYSYIFNSWAPRIFARARMENGPSVLFDNSALFAKGLILSTEVEMSKLIQESGDKELLQMYSELRLNRQMLNDLYTKPIAERQINCDSLEQVSQKLERQLMYRVKKFGDFTRNLSITWHDVQSKLSDNDIAVEFISYYDEQDSTIHYAALSLCKGDTAPELTTLFSQPRLFAIYEVDETFQTAQTDSLVWGPLSKRLNNKSRVYFAATGSLHNIGIEYLPSMESRECYRLSSTREAAGLV